MNQNTSDAEAPPERWEQTVGQKSVPLAHHNPITRQMLVMGKRREATEALLAERLRDRRTTHP
ncbi:hypothetical protein [Arthrobacter sp. ISL-95]|uniref:hypothetical protein n=1 Tax=Arthrobacter sp. ISL-95 TaxID=2819116 RepID=UPI001BE5578E|nr:hypothetical protein [Arthrobacter sp. ISL-95]MBT2586332.1 hypothetical protein [Arthrobacter sp. ISL-95]